jgi:K+-sensing histidine kinase KdpD
LFTIYTSTVFKQTAEIDILQDGNQLVEERRRNFLKKDKAATLVCVTGQRDCDRLIRAGRKIADESSGSLFVLCVQPTSAGFEANCEELEYLRQTARGADAEMSVYFHDEATLMAVGYAKTIRAGHIVTGMAEAPVNGFVEIIHKLLPHIPISMVAKDGTIYNICPAKKDEQEAIKLIHQGT